MGLPESRKWLDVETLTNFFGRFGALPHKGAPGRNPRALRLLRAKELH
jgi:hypothetical protein